MSAKQTDLKKKFCTEKMPKDVKNNSCKTDRMGKFVQADPPPPFHTHDFSNDPSLNIEPRIVLTKRFLIKTIINV